MKRTKKADANQEINVVNVVGRGKYIVMIGDQVLCRTDNGAEAVRCCARNPQSDIYARFTRPE